MHSTHLWRISKIAHEYGLKVQTLDTAAEQGRLKCYRTACGLKLVTRHDVEQWRDNPSDVGRPRA